MSTVKAAKAGAKAGAKEGGRKQFTTKEYRLLCDWLEVEGNVESILGTEGKTKIGGCHLTKKQGFESMAQYINERQYKGSTLAKLDSQGVKNRFNHLYAKYKKAKYQSDGSGWGVTEADEADGIFTIEAKLEKLCPCYDRLEIIFGNKPQVDTTGNLFVSSLIDDESAMTYTDFLTEHDSTPAQSSRIELIDSYHEMSPTTPTEAMPAATPNAPVGAMPASRAPIDSPSMPTAVRSNPPLVQMSPEAPVPSHEDSPQSDGSNRLAASVGAKYKPQRGPVYSNKKRATEKVTSLSATFASSLESLSQGKLKALEMKEKAMEQQTTTQALRAEIAKEQLSLEAQRLQLEQRKMESDIAISTRAAKVQARLDVIRMNAHRTPEEVAEIIALVENVD